MTSDTHIPHNDHISLFLNRHKFNRLSKKCPRRKGQYFEKKDIYMYMCLIPNGFRDTAISLRSSLNLAPNIMLLSRRTASLSEASESV
jgi:hypothetical protein